MGLFQLLGIKTKVEKVKEAMEEGAIIVDVRTPQEYNEGHITNSINIPLQSIDVRISMLQKKNKVVILCCRSGSRARQAKRKLESEGIRCVNGGSWGSLNYIIH